MITVKQAEHNYTHPSGVTMPRYWIAYENNMPILVDKSLETLKADLIELKIQFKVIL